MCTTKEARTNKKERNKGNSNTQGSKEQQRTSLYVYTLHMSSYILCYSLYLFVHKPLLKGVGLPKCAQPQKPHEKDM